jgi:monovalent cation:H+ antiporter-2, CPA2 family
VGHELIVLGAALLVAAVLGRAGRRIGLPTIPLFMAAGLLAGPYVLPVALVEHPEDLELLAVLGLVLLLFHLGLEFDLDDFADNAKGLVAAGSAYIVLNVGAGLGLGLALGWGTREALVVAGITGISSSAVVTKLVVELQRLTNRETPLVLGVIVVEDVFLALYLAALSPLLGAGDSLATTLLRFAGAFVFLLAMFTLARRGGRLVSRVVGGRDEELLTITFVGLAVLFAGTAEEIGVSDAIGAFLIGLAIGSTPARERVERLVRPLRDVFAAVFFLAFGLYLDPSTFGSVALPVAVAVLLTLLANFVAGLVTARLRGLGTREGVNAALLLLTRGEFALILATMAIAAGLDDRIGPFAGLYVLVLAVVGPVLAARSPEIGDALVGRLERRRRPTPPTSAEVAGGIPEGADVLEVLGAVRSGAVPDRPSADSAPSGPPSERPSGKPPGRPSGPPADGLTRRAPGLTARRVPLAPVDDPACEHLALEGAASPGSDGCAECLADGTGWVHLRVCATCGHVGCCDSSPHRHATGHARATGHPVVTSAEDGEHWAYCYEDEAVNSTVADTVEDRM